MGKVKLDVLYIKASSVISSLCYSILKLEPYSSCYYNCIYCYAKWYGVNHSKAPAPIDQLPSLFEEISRSTTKKGLKPIPFRLSTLVDPFQPCELKYGISARILRIALEYEYPLVLNTKSVLVKSGVLRELVEKLLVNELAVLQISISTLSDKYVRTLEPLAPPPNERLLLIGDFGSRGLPVIVRLSPFIPFVSPTSSSEIEELAGRLKDCGVKHVVVESLRLEPARMISLISVLGLRELPLEYYSTKRRPGLVKFSRNFLEEIYTKYSEYLKTPSLHVANDIPCFFKYSTAPDCCGLYMLKNHIIRGTLYDVYVYLTQKARTEDYVKLYSEACRNSKRIYGELFSSYPKPIAKALRWHERRLLRVLSSREELAQVAPDLHELLLT